VLVVGISGAVLLALALVAAVVKIRERRWPRYGAIVAALTLAVAYSVWNATGIPETDAVERFHFLEYGLITFLFYRAWRPLEDLSVFVLPIFAGLITGTAEEWLQWFIPNRVGELRDIFLNLFAVLCGLLFSAGVDPPPPSSLRILRRESARGVLRLAAATIIVIAAFIHGVHLGHQVVDPDVGTFVSRYSPERLLALQSDKIQEWRLTPPPLTLRRFSREDQYLSEGLAHVRWRNKQWDAGYLTDAWNENLILEKYYAPVLDTPTYEGRSGHRWPTEQRFDAFRRAGGAARQTPYVSAAYPYRVFLWDARLLWAAAAVAASALVLLGRRRYS
jgi:hypothetical protein